MSAPAAPSAAPAEPSAARAPWDRCVAWARSSGQRCRSTPAVGTRCWLHWGAALLGAGWRDPLPIWRLLVTPAGAWLQPSRTARGRWPAETARLARKWPKRCKPWAAVKLVERATVTSATLFRGSGKWLLAELKRRGVKVIADGAQSDVVRRVRFEAPPRAGSESEVDR